MPDESLRFCVIQTDIVWENPLQNRANIEQKLNTMPPCDVVVLPEMFTTGFSMRPAQLAEPMSGSSVAWMRDMAQKHGVVVCGSLMIAAEGKFFNRFIWMPPESQPQVYDKRHLFSMSEEPRFFSAGRRRLTITYRSFRIRPIVCYDLRFPVWCRNDDDYDVLLVVANWPEKRALAWKTLLEARAIENQSYVVGVNRVGTDGTGMYHSGESSVVDARGGVLWRQAHEEAIFVFTADRQQLHETRRLLPFLRDRDRFSLIDES